MRKTNLNRTSDQPDNNSAKQNLVGRFEHFGLIFNFYFFLSELGFLMFTLSHHQQLSGQSSNFHQDSLLLPSLALIPQNNNLLLHSHIWPSR